MRDPSRFGGRAGIAAAIAAVALALAWIPAGPGPRPGRSAAGSGAGPGEARDPMLAPNRALAPVRAQSQVTGSLRSRSFKWTVKKFIGPATMAQPNSGAYGTNGAASVHST